MPSTVKKTATGGNKDSHKAEGSVFPLILQRDLSRTFDHHKDWAGEVTLQPADVEKVKATVELVLKMYLDKGGEYVQGLVSICLALTHSFYVGEKVLWYSADRDRLLEACPDVFSEYNLFAVFMSIMEKYGHASSL